MKPLVLRILERTEIVLMAAIMLPLLMAVDVTGLKVLIEIGLGIVMYFSLRPFLGSRFQIKNGKMELVIPIIINYALLSLAYVVLAYIFFGTAHDFFIGYILIAITPPAVSIIPFCYMSLCDPETADIPVFVSFLLSIFIIPAVLFSLYGKTIDVQTLIRVITIIMLIPAFLAYKTHKSRSRLFDYSKAAINVCLAAVIFISMSLNRAVFLGFTNKDVIYVYIINAIVIFGLGLLVYAASRKLFPKDAVAHTFYATQKNVGTSITLGIFLFNPDTAVPAIIALAMQFIYFIFFEQVFVKRKHQMKTAGKHHTSKFFRK